MDRIGKTRGWNPYTEVQFRGGMTSEGALFMGNAEEVTTKIIEIISYFGLTRFIAHLDVGGPSHKEMLKAIELYGTKVIPAVRNAIEI